MANQKHLTLEDRQTISKLLDISVSFKAIGTTINKDCTTISKEIRNHRMFKKTGAHGRHYNACQKRFRCDVRLLCRDCKSKRHCWSCKSCNSVCPDFVKEECPKLKKAPYVCNGCIKLKSCSLEKCFYSASHSHNEYREILKEVRQGISLCEHEIVRLDNLISPLIRKGQSINHICANNKDAIMVSESTIYRLVNYNLFSARNIDLPRKVRYKKRLLKRNFKVDKACRINRTYKDFCSFINEHNEFPIVEMDTVEGVKGGKVLLTIHFVKSEFMIAFLRDTNDSQSVIDSFEHIYLALRPDIFAEIIPILLGDNGSEFSNPTAIELDRQGNQRTRVFYCDPSAPQQKGSAEKNHEFIRCFVPKGKPFDHLNQKDINLMMDNINSYSRKSIGNKCPYDMFSFLYGEELLTALECHKIRPNDVTLHSSIFQKHQE